MARIQWTPIAGPDIGEQSLRAQQMAGSALQSAFSTFGGLLNQWEGDRREENLAEVYRRQNAFAGTNDVDGYAADVADGDLIKGLSYLKAADIAGLRGFTNELRTGRNAEFAFDRQVLGAEREDETWLRAKDEREAALTIARQVQPLREQLATGKITREQYDTAVAPLLAQAQNSSQVENIYGQGRDGVQDFRGGVRWDREGVTYADGREDRQYMLKEREDRRAAAAAIEQIQDLGGTFQDLQMSSAWANANPEQRILMRQAFGGSVAGGGSGGGGSPGSFAGIQMDDAKNSVVNILQQRGASGAAIAGIMGNLEVEGGWGGALGDGGSAAGIAQWRGPRRDAFRAKYGKDPHQATHAQQAEFLAWELLTPEGRRVSGVSEEQARQIWQARDPAVAAELFDKFYERSDGRHRDRRIAAARGFAMPTPGQNQASTARTQVGAATRLGTDPVGWMSNLPAALADTNTSLAAVATRITNKDSGSPLANGDVALVQRQLREVQDRYSRMNPGKRLSAPAAALVLEQAAKPYDPGKDFFNWNRRATQRGGVFAGTQMVVDTQDIGRALEQIRPDAQGNIRGLTDTVVRTQGAAEDLQLSQAALQLVNQKRAELNQLERQDRSRRRMNNPVTDRVRMELEEAQAQLDAINGRGSARDRAAFAR